MNKYIKKSLMLLNYFEEIKNQVYTLKVYTDRSVELFCNDNCIGNFSTFERLYNYLNNVYRCIEGYSLSDLQKGDLI